MASRILVVDDEKPIADIIKFNLEREGYEVAAAYDGREALALADSQRFDLIILDIMLPEVDGFQVCRTIRARSAVPILMLTAKGEEVDKVLGLELGADDYVTKPFSPREVLARVRALLRRATGTVGPSEAQEIRVADLRIDAASYQVFRGDDEIDLTFREFELLKYLAGNCGQVITRETLLQDVWGYEYPGDVRTVDVTIRRLREKIEDDPRSPRYIHTKRGVGYYCQRSI